MAGCSRCKFTGLFRRLVRGIRRVMSFEDLVVYLAGLGRQCIRLDPELWDDIDEGADAALQLKEFVEDYHFLLLEDAIPALEIATFIADDIFRFIEDPLYLI